MEKNEWMNEVLEHGQYLSTRIEEGFEIERKKIQGKLEKIKGLDIPDAKSFIIETFMEYSIGTIVAILCNYVNDTKDFEDICVEMVREKFERMREIKNATKS